MHNNNQIRFKYHKKINNKKLMIMKNRQIRIKMKNKMIKIYLKNHKLIIKNKNKF